MQLCVEIKSRSYNVWFAGQEIKGIETGYNSACALRPLQIFVHSIVIQILNDKLTHFKFYWFTCLGVKFFLQKVSRYSIQSDKNKTKYEYG